MMMLMGILTVGAGVGYGLKIHRQTRNKKRSQVLVKESRAKPEPKPITAENDSGLLQERAATDHFLTVSLVGLGVAATGGLGYPVLSLLSVPISLYAYSDILRSAFHALFVERRLRASVLDSIVTFSWLVSRYFVALALANSVYFLGRRLLLKTEDKSHQSLTNLFREQPRTVWRLVDGVELSTAFEAIQIGDVIVVNTGEMIPIDGSVVRGFASLDQQKLTGESQPIDKTVGEQVFAATIVLAGRLEVEVERAGADTMAAQIGKILNNTEDFKATLEARSQQIADQAVLPTLGIGALALWALNPVSAIAAMSTNYSDVLRVTAPLGILNFLQIATQDGILIKDGRSLEHIKKIDTVVFDKTGTLTLDELQVGQIYCCDALSADEILRYAAIAEYRHTHPIARAIQQAAKERNLTLPDVDDANYEIGYGLRVRIGTEWVRVGSRRFMAMEQIDIPRMLDQISTQVEPQGTSLVYIAVDERLVGALELVPTVRPEAQAVIQDLKQRGLQLYIISGDHEQPTRQLATELGIENYFAEVLPNDKAELISQLQGQGRSVCFVGDGINDSIALKKANVSVSIRGASTIATDTAQIVLMSSTIEHLPQVFELGHDLQTSLRGAIATTFVPGLICVGGVFFLHFGIYMSAIVGYNLSLVAGVANAMLPKLRYEKQKSLFQQPEKYTEQSRLP